MGQLKLNIARLRRRFPNAQIYLSIDDYLRVTVTRRIEGTIADVWLPDGAARVNGVIYALEDGEEVTDVQASEYWGWIEGKTNAA